MRGSSKVLDNGQNRAWVRVSEAAVAVTIFTSNASPEDLAIRCKMTNGVANTNPTM
jgi:hypothetical protein